MEKNAWLQPFCLELAMGKCDFKVYWFVVGPSNLRQLINLGIQYPEITHSRLPNRLMPGESEYKPGVMMKNLALSLADGAAWSKIRSKHHVLHEVLLKEILYHTRTPMSP